MGPVGLEPTRDYSQRILNPLRLPITPRPQLPPAENAPVYTGGSGLRQVAPALAGNSEYARATSARRLSHHFSMLYDEPQQEDGATL